MNARSGASFAFVVLLLAAASPGAAPEQPEPSTYRRNIERIPTLDPMDSSSVPASRAVSLVYETPLEYDYQARPYRLIPGLARALPEISPDGRIYTLRLRNDARFVPDPCFGRDAAGQPRGRPVVAADVVFSLLRLADAKLSSSGYWLIDGRIAGLEAFRAQTRGRAPSDYDLPVAGLTAPDATTVRIELTQPCPPFIWMLAMSYASVVPREAVAYYGASFNEHPVGSGPYRLSEWRRNHRMLFTRNPDWTGWRAGPAACDPATGRQPFERLLFPVMDDASTQWLAFLAGELDLQGEIARDSWDAVVDRQGALQPALAQRGIRLTAMPTLEVAYIGINMAQPLLGTNRPLRQALNCAFDGARWEQYYQGRVVRADGPVPPGVAGHLDAPAPYAFDLARARTLLAEAGYPEGRDPATGRRLRLSLDLGRTTQDVRESTELLVAFLERVGIELEPIYLNWPAFLQKVSRRETQMFRIGWVGDYPDAENFLQLFYGPNAAPGPNRCNYADPRFDALYTRALATADDAERLRLYGEMQAIVREACPWIFIHFPRAYSLHHARVLDYAPHDFPYGMEKYLRTPNREP